MPTAKNETASARSRSDQIIASLAVLDARAQDTHTRLNSVDGTIKYLAESVSNIVRLDERLTQLTKRFDEGHENDQGRDDRLRTIEAALPGLKEMRRWIIVGVMGVLSLVGATVWNTIVSNIRYGNASIAISAPASIPTPISAVPAPVVVAPQ